MPDQLFEPAPLRTVPARHGACSWWGVDFSTTRLALAFVDVNDYRDATTIVFPKADGPMRLAGIYAATYVGVRRLLEWAWPPPAYVSLERPAGKHVNPPLVMAVGCAQAGLYAALKAEGHDPAFGDVASAHWKQVACGYGAIYKPKRPKGGPIPKQDAYQVFRWAREQGWNPTSWDEADAAGMAEAARLEVALDIRPQ